MPSSPFRANQAAAEGIAERGRRIDEAFARARKELEALRADMVALHKLGVTHPRAEQLAVLGSLALASAVVSLPLKFDRAHLAPRERTSFAELCTTWQAQITRWAAPFLEREAA